MKSTYRVIMNGSTLSDSCLVSGDCLADFIYQERNIPQMWIYDSALNWIKVERGEVLNSNQPGVVTQLNTSIQAIKEADCSGEWTSLSLYKFFIEVFHIESYYLFSSDKEKAKQDFSAWSIFDAIEVQSIA